MIKIPITIQVLKERETPEPITGELIAAAAVVIAAIIGFLSYVLRKQK